MEVRENGIVLKDRSGGNLRLHFTSPFSRDTHNPLPLLSRTYARVSMIDPEIQYLISHQAVSREHSGASLISHLAGTRDILKSWDARRCVWQAGMFHSVYGTQSFEGFIELRERPSVRRMIGEEAEALVCLFC